MLSEEAQHHGLLERRRKKVRGGQYAAVVRLFGKWVSRSKDIKDDIDKRFNSLIGVRTTCAISVTRRKEHFGNELLVGQLQREHWGCPTEGELHIHALQGAWHVSH